MLNFVSQQHLNRLPDAGQRRAAQRGEHGQQGAPVGAERSISPKTALANMQTTFGQLPTTQRGTSYP